LSTKRHIMPDWFVSMQVMSYMSLAAAEGGTVLCGGGPPSWARGKPRLTGAGWLGNRQENGACLVVSVCRRPCPKCAVRREGRKGWLEGGGQQKSCLAFSIPPSFWGSIMQYWVCWGPCAPFRWGLLASDAHRRSAHLKVQSRLLRSSVSKPRRLRPTHYQNG
jgi:hypothetical protein